LPIVLTAHASVTGAKYGSERTVMLGNELVLAQSLVRDPRIDYVALGHIHKHQNLNPDSHPPVVYAGSIERIDFGEAGETKGFVLANVSKGATHWEFVPLETRPFVDIRITLDNAETVTDDILNHIPPPEQIEGAIVRLQLTYSADWEALIDDAVIQKALEPALDSRIIKNRQTESRSRLGDTAGVETLSPPDLLDLYWKTNEMDPAEAAELQTLGAEIIHAVEETAGVRNSGSTA
jgi:exonuclease SbcD